MKQGSKQRLESIPIMPDSVDTLVVRFMSAITYLVHKRHSIPGGDPCHNKYECVFETVT